MSETTTELEVTSAKDMDVTPAAKLTSLDILDSAVRGGITSENVAVVQSIIAMRREERAYDAKVLFNRAFFELRKEIGRMDFFADKAAKDDSGRVAYRYCSEKELSAGLEPVLFKHGFAMLFSQRDEDQKTVAVITLIHADGHEVKGEFAVRSGATNRMKDATAADTGATTSAWRHLVIKMFGLKSRISESDDARNLGDLATKVTKEIAFELERRVAECNLNAATILKYAGSDSFANIPAVNYAVLDRMISAKEKAAR